MTGITITDAGEGYTSAPTITIADTGTGTGATATATLGGLTAALAGATMVYTAGAFVLTLSGADNIGFMETHSQAVGTDISGLLAMRQDSAGVAYLPGHDTEAVVDAVGEMVRLASGATPVALMRDAKHATGPQRHRHRRSAVSLCAGGRLRLRPT